MHLGSGLLSIGGDRLDRIKYMAFRIDFLVEIELFHESSGPYLSPLSQLEQIIFILLFTMLQPQQHLLLLLGLV